MRLFRLLALIQGIYFILTGIWPVLDIQSFMAVTGPKTDLWLVKTVGLLIMMMGVIFVFSFQAKQPSIYIALLAIGSSLVLGFVDIVYVLEGSISPIYLADALAEFALIAWWITALARNKKKI